MKNERVAAQKKKMFLTNFHFHYFNINSRGMYYVYKNIKLKI